MKSKIQTKKKEEEKESVLFINSKRLAVSHMTNNKMIQIKDQGEKDPKKQITFSNNFAITVKDLRS
jgi:hypothetical protein